jgi:hypothetical protein
MLTPPRDSSTITTVIERSGSTGAFLSLRLSAGERKGTMKRHIGSLLALAAAVLVSAPKAQARLFPEYNDDRLSLMAEHVYAVGWPDPWDTEMAGDWNYIASDFGAYLRLARSPLAPFMTVKNDTYAGWPDERIWSLVANTGPGWGGQCFSYVSLLLLRSGNTDESHLLLSYHQLQVTVTRQAREGVIKNWRGGAEWGDIAFKYDGPGGKTDHVMILLQAAPGGMLVGDSNWGLDERIRTHLVPWDKLEREGYRVVDLTTLLKELGSRR